MSTILKDTNRLAREVRAGSITKAKAIKELKGLYGSSYNDTALQDRFVRATTTLLNREAKTNKAQLDIIAKQQVEAKAKAEAQAKADAKSKAAEDALNLRRDALKIRKPYSHKVSEALIPPGFGLANSPTEKPPKLIPPPKGAAPKDIRARVEARRRAIEDKNIAESIANDTKAKQLEAVAKLKLRLNEAAAGGIESKRGANKELLASLIHKTGESIDASRNELGLANAKLTGYSDSVKTANVDRAASLKELSDRLANARDGVSQGISDSREALVDVQTRQQSAIDSANAKATEDKLAAAKQTRADRRLALEAGRPSGTAEVIAKEPMSGGRKALIAGGVVAATSLIATALRLTTGEDSTTAPQSDIVDPINYMASIGKDITPTVLEADTTRVATDAPSVQAMVQNDLTGVVRKLTKAEEKKYGYSGNSPLGVWTNLGAEDPMLYVGNAPLPVRDGSKLPADFGSPVDDLAAIQRSNNELIVKRDADLKGVIADMQANSTEYQQLSDYIPNARRMAADGDAQAIKDVVRLENSMNKLQDKIYTRASNKLSRSPEYKMADNKLNAAIAAATRKMASAKTDAERNAVNTPFAKILMKAYPALGADGVHELLGSRQAMTGIEGYLGEYLVRGKPFPLSRQLPRGVADLNMRLYVSDAKGDTATKQWQATALTQARNNTDVTLLTKANEYSHSKENAILAKSPKAIAELETQYIQNHYGEVYTNSAKASIMGGLYARALVGLPEADAKVIASYISQSSGMDIKGLAGSMQDVNVLAQYAVNLDSEWGRSSIPLDIGLTKSTAMSSVVQLIQALNAKSGAGAMPLPTADFQLGVDPMAQSSTAQ